MRFGYLEEASEGWDEDEVECLYMWLIPLMCLPYRSVESDMRRVVDTIFEGVMLVIMAFATAIATTFSGLMDSSLHRTHSD